MRPTRLFGCLLSVSLLALIAISNPGCSESADLSKAKAGNTGVDRAWLTSQQEFIDRLTQDVSGPWTHNLDRMAPNGRVDQRVVNRFSSEVNQAANQVNRMLNHLDLIKQGFGRGDNVEVPLSLIESTEQKIRDEVLTSVWTYIPNHLYQLQDVNANPSTAIVALRREMQFLGRSLLDVTDLLQEWAGGSGGSVDGPFGMRFSRIPAGSFMMGSPSSEDGRDSDEGPQHKVTISKGFEMGVTEVTRGQWHKVMGSYPDNNPFGWIDGICHPTVKEDHHPVTCVSWRDAQDFTSKLNEEDSSYHYRLPTEAEWEYAARAGTTGKYSVDGPLESFAWYRDNSGGKTHPVAQLKPNGFGLYDMHGNVWEWAADWYGDYPSSHVTDPKGPSSGSDRVFRGGSWSYSAQGVRSAVRGYARPDYRNADVGLRLSRTPK